jgi:rhodanese-related sulfurtransferase
MTPSPHPRPSVDAPSLQERLGDPATPRLIDVRTPAEYEAGHIPGAVNVPLDRLKGSLDELCGVLHDQDVVLVCRSGQRAGQAQEALRSAGLTAPVLAGGMSSWTATGGPVKQVEQGRRVWELERQVRLVAGVLVLLSVLGSLLVPGLQWVAAGIGAGLTVAALSNTCAMGSLLARMPWNRRGGGASVASLSTAR